MVDVELIEFKAPTGSSKLIFLTKIQSRAGHDEAAITEILTQYFSRWGLLHSVRLMTEEDEDKTYLAYLRYYSARATALARRQNEGLVCLEEEKIVFRVSRCGSQSVCNLPLSRSKCEELANYYLGFNNWSSEILYHRREEGPEVDPATLCYVTVVKLAFKQSGLDCEGAGKCEAPKEDFRSNMKLMSELAKRSKGEAMLAAWGKVILVILDGERVSLEINTTKKDNFFYDPTWDEHEVVVNEVDDNNTDTDTNIP